MSATRKVPLAVADIGEAELEAVRATLETGWLTDGPCNREFEEEFARLIGVPHAISMNSCTSALFLALVANEIRGSVIIPSFTWCATANAVVTAGAECVFADIEPDTGNIDPAQIESLIDSRTEAIIAVHYAGHAADMERIAAIAERHHLLLVEDSAEALGAKMGGVYTGGWGVGCYSFYPTKAITTGEGGMYTTRSDEEARNVRALIAHGIDSTAHSRERSERPWQRAARLPGYNFRLSNLLAALGTVQLRRLDAMNQARRRHAKAYGASLSQEFFELPVERPGCEHVYQMYAARLREGVDRTAFLKEMRARGIGASAHFDPPVHKHPYYQENGFADVELPHTDRFAETVVTLPMYPGLGDDDVEYVARGANEAAAAQRS